MNSFIVKKSVYSFFSAGIYTCIFKQMLSYKIIVNKNFIIYIAEKLALNVFFLNIYFQFPVFPRKSILDFLFF